MEEGSFPLWHGLIKMFWPKLVNPLLVYTKNNKEPMRNCKWSPPQKGWENLNFNGVARGNLVVVGIRCIINTNSGKWLAKNAMSINPTNNLAEVTTLEEDLRICLQLGISKLIIEGDYQIVLNAIRNISTPNWILNLKLEEFIHWLNKFKDTRICHIYREGNSKVDSLANVGVDDANFVKLSQGI